MNSLDAGLCVLEVVEADSKWVGDISLSCNESLVGFG